MAKLHGKNGVKKNNFVNPNFWSGKKVLITGHTGFKGSWLSIWLKMMGVDLVGIALQSLLAQLYLKKQMLPMAW